jgi:hypothetical protein
MMVVVRSKVAHGLSLVLVLAGCATGAVTEGIPFESDGAPTLASDASTTIVGSSTATDASAPPSLLDGGPAREPTGSTMPQVPAAPGADAGGKPPAVVPPKDAGNVVMMPQPNRDAGSMPPTPSARDLSTDKAKFLGGPRCDKAGALLCDDFESEAAGAPADPNVWTPVLSNASSLAQVDSARAARGTKSMHLRAASGQIALLENTKLFPAMKNTVYGRMFVWIDALPTAPDNARFLLASATGTNLKTEVRLLGQYRLEESRNLLGVGSDLGESGDWYTAGKEPGSVPRAKDWMCLEWLFKGDTSETRVWVDGTEQTSLHTTATEFRDGDQEMGKKFVHPEYTKLRVGWWLYQSDATPASYDVWVDEVIVDDERIGCVL